MCCDVMWCVVMCCDVCDVLWCVVICCVVMWFDVLWCDVMCCDVMWCVVMWCVVMCCDVMCVYYRRLQNLCKKRPANLRKRSGSRSPIRVFQIDDVARYSAFRMQSHETRNQSLLWRFGNLLWCDVLWCAVLCAGDFEVTVNGNLLFSKKKTGTFPDMDIVSTPRACLSQPGSRTL